MVHWKKWRNRRYAEKRERKKENKKENKEKRKERKKRRELGEGGTEQEMRRECTVGHIGRRRLKESETVRQEDRRKDGQKKGM